MFRFDPSTIGLGYVVVSHVMASSCIFCMVNMWECVFWL